MDIYDFKCTNCGASLNGENNCNYCGSVFRIIIENGGIKQEKLSKYATENIYISDEDEYTLDNINYSIIEGKKELVNKMFDLNFASQGEVSYIHHIQKILFQIRDFSSDPDYILGNPDSIGTIKKHHLFRTGLSKNNNNFRGYLDCIPCITINEEKNGVYVVFEDSYCFIEFLNI